MFAYPDAQRYRLGVNYTQLPSNRSIAPVYAPYERDGVTSSANYGGHPNYVRSSLSPGVTSTHLTTQVVHTERIESAALLGLNEITVDDEDFEQPRELWTRVFDNQEKLKWAANVAETLVDLPAPLRAAVHAMFSKVHPIIGEILAGQGSRQPHL